MGFAFLPCSHTLEARWRSQCRSLTISLLTMFYCDCFIVQSIGDQTGVTQLGFFVSARHCKAGLTLSPSCIGIIIILIIQSKVNKTINLSVLMISIIFTKLLIIYTTDIYLNNTLCNTLLICHIQGQSITSIITPIHKMNQYSQKISNNKIHTIHIQFQEQRVISPKITSYKASRRLQIQYNDSSLLSTTSQQSDLNQSKNASQVSCFTQHEQQSVSTVEKHIQTNESSEKTSQTISTAQLPAQRLFSNTKSQVQHSNFSRVKNTSIKPKINPHKEAFKQILSLVNVYIK
ncbi:Hypothetical_protein [Hexamita inflata]|uniref:Hypothetical_protein n=1 Tax=Hexamita inflata TaxID=28002 RepID=A0AA86TZF7_9EUKA|nr:Hypothetical protein HINF_LOCUS23490 [Hexamita inflata]